ncbi:toxin co-regulated pilus biosynthesis Q family protein [Erwinia pyrifoliae]|uniref:toxin co-regulated pilus biosynthesis Q family protein n=1 Tax=Erwinia pyrifoliae TaxID=79967 RepID=UPI0021FD251D|nr:toxin co-regulated pilus biosynthesis Q family protein [Erwinia pyrifoliae]MCU8585750.1 toxin co-regulated pilus biosynthesis Q family protein [Erwinia pyrifoliae]UWS28956.1 toxin co-regulated pilus biosynthesis Q family protein [Erwinia pyrifoliae]
MKILTFLLLTFFSFAIQAGITTQTLLAPSSGLTRPVTYRGDWVIEPQNTLKGALMTWASLQACNIQGIPVWKVKWLTSVNYPIDAPLHFTGSFREALTAVLTLYLSANKPLTAKIYASQCLVTVDSPGNR